MRWTYPGNTQHVIRVPDLWNGSRSDDDEINHSRDHRPSSDAHYSALDSPLSSFLLLALLLDQVHMFGCEVGRYPCRGILQFCGSVSASLVWPMWAEAYLC